MSWKKFFNRIRDICYSVKHNYYHDWDAFKFDLLLIFFFLMTLLAIKYTSEYFLHILHDVDAVSLRNKQFRWPSSNGDPKLIKKLKDLEDYRKTYWGRNSEDHEKEMLVTAFVIAVGIGKLMGNITNGIIDYIEEALKEE